MAVSKKEEQKIGFVNFEEKGKKQKESPFENQVCCHNSLIYRQHAWHVEKKGIYGALLSIIKGYIYFSTAGLYCGQGIMYCKLGQLGLFFWFIFFGLFTIPLLTFLMGIEWCCYLFARFLTILFLFYHSFICLNLI